MILLMKLLEIFLRILIFTYLRTDSNLQLNPVTIDFSRISPLCLATSPRYFFFFINPLLFSKIAVFPSSYFTVSPFQFQGHFYCYFLSRFLLSSTPPQHNLASVSVSEQPPLCEGLPERDHHVPNNEHQQATPQEPLPSSIYLSSRTITENLVWW